MHPTVREQNEMEEGSHKNGAKERDEGKKEIWKEMAPSLMCRKWSRVLLLFPEVLQE